MRQSILPRGSPHHFPFCLSPPPSPFPPAAQTKSNKMRPSFYCLKSYVHPQMNKHVHSHGVGWLNPHKHTPPFIFFSPWSEFRQKNGQVLVGGNRFYTNLDNKQTYSTYLGNTSLVVGLGFGVWTLGVF